MKKLIMLLAFAGLPLFAGCPPSADRSVKQQKVFIIKKRLFFDTIYYQCFTPELLKEAIYYLEIKSPEIVFNQMILETGNFTSDIFYYGRNLTGMKRARVRPTTAIGTYKRHAEYSHWFNSVKDYRLFQDWYEQNGHSLDEYFVFLQDIKYATDKRYINKLKSIS